MRGRPQAVYDTAAWGRFFCVKGVTVKLARVRKF